MERLRFRKHETLLHIASYLHFDGVRMKLQEKLERKKCVGGDHHLLTSLETGHGGFEQSYCNYQIMFKKQVY